MRPWLKSLCSRLNCAEIMLRRHLQSSIMDTESSDADRRWSSKTELLLKVQCLRLGLRTHALTGATSVFCKGIVRIAVQPSLPGLRRGNHRMSTGVRVPCGMAVWRTVATQGRATHLTRPQMNPSGANLDALIAFLAFRMAYGCELIEMRTGSFRRHRLSLFV
jgi:hypothetical protein